MKLFVSFYTTVSYAYIVLAFIFTENININTFPISNFYRE